MIWLESGKRELCQAFPAAFPAAVAGPFTGAFNGFPGAPFAAHHGALPYGGHFYGQPVSFLPSTHIKANHEMAEKR